MSNLTTIKEIKHVLINDYGIPSEIHNVLMSEVCNDYGIEFDDSDIELWEVLLDEIKTLKPKPNVSIVEKLTDIKAECKEEIDKREVKQEDKKDITDRSIQRKSRTILKVNKTKVANGSVADISNKAVITDIGDGFLFNIDRAYALHFIQGNAYLIRKKLKQSQPLKLGYFISLSPNYIFQTIIPYEQLTHGEHSMINNFFAQLRILSDNAKLLDLRYYLQMTDIYEGIDYKQTEQLNGKDCRYKAFNTVNDEQTKITNLNRFKTFRQWLDTISFKALEHWLTKCRKRGIDTKGYYDLTDGQRILNTNRIYSVWCQYHYNA